MNTQSSSHYSLEQLLVASGKRMLKLYQVSPADVDLAKRIVEIQFEVRKDDQDRTIILPQIADWMWHESILNTRWYAAVCADRLGFKLEHLQIEPDEFGFEETCRWLLDDWGITLPNGWLEAGWDTPQYRFRDNWSCALTLLTDDAARQFQEHHWSELSRFEIPIDLQWLVDRIEKRFGVPRAWAKLSVSLYSSFLLDQCSGLGMNGWLEIPPLLWAWQEHVLWTERYSADCDRLLGRFLHHTPTNVKGMFNSLGGTQISLIKSRLVRLAA